MKKFIALFGIEKMFISKEGSLIIISTNGNELEGYELNEAIADDRNYSRSVNFDLLSEFNKSIHTQKSPSESSFSIFFSLPLKRKISDRFDDPSTFMKEDINIWLATNPANPFFERIWD